jgi:hypothetical protein
MKKHHCALGGVVALALALTLAGCSDGGTDPNVQDTPTATPSSTAPTTASPTPKSAEDFASAALMRYFTIAEKAEKSGKLKDLEPLSEVAIGQAFSNEREKLTAYNTNGVRLRGTVQHELGDIYTVDAGTFVISDCEDRSKSKVVVLSSGNEVPFTDPDGNPMPDRVKVDYTLAKRTEREWVVEAFDVRWR